MTQPRDAGEYQPVNSSPINLPSEELGENGTDQAHSDAVTRAQAWCLYLSHFLSMWNSRMYEFSAILFIQAAFPGNLTASSINGIAETVCVLLFSSALGRWVDRAPSRLHTLLLTISINRITVVASCLIWFLILSSQVATHKHILFAFVLLLGMTEKNSRMTNILSIERDWVPTLAASAFETSFDLTHLNTVMRRIDMVCKFLAPLAISTFIFAVAPVKVAVCIVAILSMLSFGIECCCVKLVWRQNPRLRVLKNSHLDLATSNQLIPCTSSEELSPRPRLPAPHLFLRITSEVKASIHSHMDGLRYFFNTSVWIPSLCVALLHASVLTWSATFITYLLNAGFSLGTVTVAKAIGSLFEIGSTFIFPWAVGAVSGAGTLSGSYGMGELYKTEAQDGLLARTTDGESSEVKYQDYEQQKPTTHNLNASVAQLGLWGICGLFLNLIPVMLSLFHFDSNIPIPDSSNPPLLLKEHLFPTIILITFLSFSLLGRWTYDLSTMQLTQTLVPASYRSSFGGTEMAIVSCVSLVHWVAAAIWHAQTDFKWLALGSFVAVGIGTAAYGWWLRDWEKGGGGFVNGSDEDMTVDDE